MNTPETSFMSRLPGWAKLAIGVAVIVALGLCALALLNAVATSRWERYAARLREAGEPLTFEEIEARRTVVPRERNSALFIERISEEFQGLKEPAGTNGVLGFDDSLRYVGFFTGIPRDAVDPSREYLERYRAILDDLPALSDMPSGRFDVSWEGDLLGIMLPGLSRVRFVSKLAHLDGTVMLLDGDLEGAADSVLVQYRIGAAFNEYPLVIARLVQIAVDMLATTALENTLRVGELREDSLAQFMEEIEAHLAANTMKWSLWSERASFANVCDQLAAGKLSIDGIFGAGPGNPSVGGLYRLAGFLIRRNQITGVETLTWLVEAADDPQDMLAAAKRIEQEVPKLSRTQFLVRALIPSLIRAVELHIRSNARLQCARVALAAERFRMSVGHLPASIEELVPEYLDAVPIDPFDGKPMRLAVTDDGIVIYSIGNDLVDDGGIVVKQEGRKGLPPDAGFRLVRPDRRGVVLIDEEPND